MQGDIGIDMLLWIILTISIVVLYFLSIYRFSEIYFLIQAGERIFHPRDMIVSMYMSICMLYLVSARNKQVIIHRCIQILAILSLYLLIFPVVFFGLGLFLFFVPSDNFLFLYFVISLCTMLLFYLLVIKCILSRLNTHVQERKKLHEKEKLVSRD